MLALARRGALPLYAALRERRVTHLVAGEAAVARLPLDDPAFERCFRPLWSGDGGRLWELAERCGEAA